MWPMITTNYTPLAKETDTVSFNDDELELTGRKIAAFTYKGTRYQVWTWVDMLIQLCRIIYAEEPIQRNGFTQAVETIGLKLPKTAMSTRHAAHAQNAKY